MASVIQAAPRRQWQVQPSQPGALLRRSRRWIIGIVLGTLLAPTGRAGNFNHNGDFDGDGQGDYGVSWPDDTAGVMWRMWRSTRGYSGHDDSNWNGIGFRPVLR